MSNVHWKMQVSRGIFSASAVVTVSKALSCLIKSHQHHTILMQILLFIKRLTDCTTSTTCGQTNTTTGQTSTPCGQTNGQTTNTMNG